MSNALTPDEYQAVLRSIPINPDRVDVRILAIALTGMLEFGLLKPLMYILLVPDSPIYKVNQVASMPWLVPILFGLGAALASLHLAVLVLRPTMLGWRLPRKLAALAGGMGTVAWAMLAWTSRPLDFGVAPLLYYASAVGCVVVTGVYSISLNAQQLRDIAREYLKEEQADEKV